MTQTLNFGLPAPIDIQITVRNLDKNSRVADKMMTELSHVRGITDLRIQQQGDYPKFHIVVDRTKAAQDGLTEHDVANSMLVSLSGSFQVTPMFYLNFEQWRRLQPGHTDAAIRHAVRSGSTEYSDQRPEPEAPRDPCRCRVHSADR